MHAIVRKRISTWIHRYIDPQMTARARISQCMFVHVSQASRATFRTAGDITMGACARAFIFVSILQWKFIHALGLHACVCPWKTLTGNTIKEYATIHFDTRFRIQASHSWIYNAYCVRVKEYILVRAPKHSPSILHACMHVHLNFWSFLQCVHMCVRVCMHEMLVMCRLLGVHMAEADAVSVHASRFVCEDNSFSHPTHVQDSRHAHGSSIQVINFIFL